jgi:hypothetical protein
MRDRSGRGLATLTVAVGGVFVAHWLAYVALRPAAPARAGLLAATGHAYLAGAADLAVFLAVTAAAWIVLSRLAGGASAPPPFRARYARIAFFQVTAYVGLEVAERLHGGFDSLPAVLAVGLVTQLAVAGLVAWAVGALLRFADGASDLVGRAPFLRPPTRWALLAPVRTSPASHRRAGPSGIRAPPFPR